MRRENELKRRLRSLETLGEAVGAMKSLSAHHFREARGAVEPAHAYREGVEQFLAWSGANLAAGDGPAGLLVLGGELGLCGSYNARIVAHAAEHRSQLGAGPTFCVGQRAAILLGRHDVAIAQTYSTPSSIRGITKLLLRLAEDVLTLYLSQRLSRFDIVSARFGGVGADVPTTVNLLPLATPRKASAPTIRYVSNDDLATAAMREFLYITLYDLLLDALAAEHGARLVATQSAEKWLDERSAQLRRHLAATRRESSTQEVLEIASGAGIRKRAQLAAK